MSNLREEENYLCSVIKFAQAVFPLGGNGKGAELIPSSPEPVAYTRGEKYYELSNHLGNVSSTITDRKIQTYWEGVYVPDVKSFTDYYPFGFPMEDRSWQQIAYRYGFNGQENDNEIYGVGNFLNFEFRGYDSRLGRWWSVDPQNTSQPSWSSYKAFYDNPIIFSDPDGKKEYLKIVMIDEKGQKVPFKGKISNKVMTDGVKHLVPGWKPSKNLPTSSWSYENRYYDFERVITMTTNKDGSISTTESINILKDKVRDAEAVWFGGDKAGDTKLLLADWLESVKTGSSQKSGFNWVMEGGSIDPTRTKATEGGVHTIDIGPFLTALGVLGMTPGQLPNIKEALGGAEFLNTIKGLMEETKDLRKAKDPLEKISIDYEKPGGWNSFKMVYPEDSAKTTEELIKAGNKIKE